jgi:hypothetical protein
VFERHFQQYISYIMATSFIVNNRARTHAVMVIGLYELLGNPTTRTSPNTWVNPGAREE